MKKKLLFVYPHTSTFIQLDIKILADKFSVETNTDDWQSKVKTPVNLIKQFFFLLLNIHRFEYIVVSFGGYWSFLPSLFGRVFGKKTFIILHGTDCAAFEEINYGNLRKQPLKQFCKWSYKLAYRLLPVSESLVYTENTYFDKERVIKQGYVHFFPEIKTPYTVIPNGFELDKWQNDSSITTTRSPNSFVSVASGNSLYLKGIDLILKIAKSFKEYRFHIVGFSDNENLYSDCTNVYFHGRITQEKLKELFYSSTFYLQLSITEGFGCALCEAMLCGCIPIGSNVNAIPEIIGEAGYILKNRDSKELMLLIQNNISKNTALSELSTEKISRDYPISRRKHELLETMDGKSE